MNRRYITAALTVIAVALIAFRLTHRKHVSPPHGLETVLVHDCSNEEAYRELGDDRQIIVTSQADGSLSINATPSTASSIGAENGRDLLVPILKTSVVHRRPTTQLRQSDREPVRPPSENRAIHRSNANR